MPCRPALLTTALVFGCATLFSVARAAPAAQDAAQKKAVTFTADIAPLLAEKCRPCHFKGGKVFDKLPFDQYTTVAKIAARLNTRLKGPDAALVTRWIEAGSAE